MNREQMMKSKLRIYLSVFILLAFYLAPMASCHAGGSILWEDVRVQIVKEDPFLADYIAKNLEMRRVGGGLRVGQDKDGNSLVPGLEVGERIAPFEFPAKPKGAAGDYTVMATLDSASFDNNKVTLWTLTLRKRLPSE